MTTKVTKRKATIPVMRNHAFNQKMRERRESLGYSLQTLADKVGSGSKSYLADIEKGKYAVSIEMGLAICQVLEIPPHICIDFIVQIELERVERQIRVGYLEWVDMTPDNVREKMLKDESSARMHELFSSGRGKEVVSWQ